MEGCPKDLPPQKQILRDSFPDSRRSEKAILEKSIKGELRGCVMCVRCMALDGHLVNLDSD